MISDPPQADTEVILGGVDYSGTRGSDLYDAVKLHLALARAAKEKGGEE